MRKGGGPCGRLSSTIRSLFADQHTQSSTRPHYDEAGSDAFYMHDSRLLNAFRKLVKAHPLHFIAVASQEVELDGGQDTHNDEYRDGGDVLTRTQTAARRKRDVWLGLVGEDRQREEGEGRDVDQQAGSQHQQPAEVAVVDFAAEV